MHPLVELPHKFGLRIACIRDSQPASCPEQTCSDLFDVFVSVGMCYNYFTSYTTQYLAYTYRSQSRIFVEWN